MEDVKDSKNLAFQDLFELFGLKHHVGCPTHQSGQTVKLIITKEEDTLCMSEPVEKCYISDHSFVHSQIRARKPQAVRRTIRTRRMRALEQEEIKTELDKIGGVIKRESSIENVGNDRVKALFDQFFER